MPLDTSQESGPKIFGTSSQTITSGLLAALVAGSVVLFGRIYIPETSTQTTIIQRGTGSLLTSWDSISGTTCSNTGGLAKYSGCSAQNPSSGTAAIINLRLDADTWPVAATQATCMTSPNGTSTGEVIFKYKKPFTRTASSTGTGGAITASGNNLPLIPPSWYVRCWFDRTPGNLKTKLRILTQDTYIP